MAGHPVSGRRSRGARGGYVLVYIIVAVAMVAVVGALAMPAAASTADREAASRTYAQLADLDSGIVTFGTVIKHSQTVYPGAIHQLSTLVTTADDESCGGVAMNNNSIKAWNTYGPFTSQYPTTAGLHTPIGIVNDSVEHASSGAPMYLRIPSVDTAMLTHMDDLVDGSDGGAAGTILFAITSSPTADLLYRVGFAPDFTLKKQC